MNTPHKTGSGYSVLAVVDGAKPSPLRDLMIHHNMGVVDLAAAVDVKPETVSRWLSNRGRVPGDHLAKVCHIFGVSFTDLLYSEEME